MRSTDIDRRIEAVASRQYNVFTRQQAFEEGASERFVQRRLTDQTWTRPVPGVYALAGRPADWLRQCKIAELSVAGSAIAGRSAAALHGFAGFRRGTIELVAPANAYCRNPLATVHRFAGAATTTVKGIRVTTTAQTFHDLHVMVSPLRIEPALDRCLLDGAVTIAELRERAAFYVASRRPGLALLQALVDERSDDAWIPPESKLEARLFEMLARLPSRPRVQRQVTFAWREGRSARVDALLPDHRLIIEGDGRGWHTRVADFDVDRWRDNEATAHGYRTQRFTWLHLTQMVPASIDQVERALKARAAA